MSAGVATIGRSAACSMLSRAARDVVDQFGTVLAEPAEDMHAFSRDACLLSCSCFHGPVAGLVSIAAPQRLCESMALGMVVGDGCAAESSLMAESLIAELANMIASRVAFSLEPAELVFMTPPTVERSSHDDWVTLDGARDTVRLNVDGWPLLASLAFSRS